eukprot:m.206937 g.206937  ORF g.206937 m.206937 type:complete len:743 (+) comp23523_c0_seq1:131-2359(+)
MIMLLLLASIPLALSSIPSKAGGWQHIGNRRHDPASQHRVDIIDKGDGYHDNGGVGVGVDAGAGITVLVYGSTPGAVMSAVAAARTLQYNTSVTTWNVTLVDPSPRLGGMCSGGLGSSDIGDPIVIGGLAHEFFVRVAQTYNASATTPEYYLEPHVAEQVFYDMLAEAHVDIVKHGRVVSVQTTEIKVGSQSTSTLQQPSSSGGRAITSIVMEDGVALGGPQTVFIDGTYEGDLMARANVTYTYGRESMQAYNESYAGRREPWAQGAAHTGGKSGDYAAVNPLLPNGSLPWSHPLVTELYAAPFGSADNKVQGYNFRLCVTRNTSNQVPFPKPARYNRDDWDLLFKMATTPGGDTIEKYLNNWGHPLPNGKMDLNNGGIISTDCTSCSWDYPDSNYTYRAEIVQHHKDYQQGFLWTLAHDSAIPAPVRASMAGAGLCKDEFVSNDHWPEQLYIREARRMIGDVVYTQNDVQARRDYGTRSIGCGSYNFDAHYSHRGPCVANAQRNGCTMLTGPPPPGAVIWLGGEGYAGANHGTYEFPLDLLLPKRVEASNFLNPVTPSTTHVSFATVRMEPQFMTLGHSAGVVAALAVAAQTAVHDVNETTMHAILLEQGQVLSSPAPPPAGVSYGCLADVCVPLDHPDGNGKGSATCTGTPCAGRVLGADAWLMMQKHFGPVQHTPGSNVWNATAQVDTHLKKSEVNSQSLPVNMTLAVRTGTTIWLSAAPVLNLEEGYGLVTCRSADCT